MNSRLTTVEIPNKQRQSFCSEVAAGLEQTPKSLPTRYLYDHAGSDLFEAITDLPEYYLTRAESEIFDQHADEMMLAASAVTLIEFGSGSSKKTRKLIEAGLAQGTLQTYVPIDISKDFLQETASLLLVDYPELDITAVAAEYFDAADELPEFPKPKLILFLGSNIGNLTHSEAVDFLTRLRKHLRPGDHLLIGVDLEKDPSVIESAYDDSQHVTANFNLNLLKRINRELDGNFCVDQFQHHAPFLTEERRIEMRLYALEDQVVNIEAIGREYKIAKGEFIHTEWSHKYSPERFASLCAEANLTVEQSWLDSKGWFATMLLAPINS
ncbi:L-histidine N(alpha)-methyltransferase [soil metagenome]